MFNLKYQFTNNIPVFKCNFCGKCNGVLESTSKINIMRGCCWYFPKYTLVDIKNIIDNGNYDFVLKLFKNPRILISQYHIQMIGSFDRKEYDKYISHSCGDTQNNFDSKLFFRTCPFVSTKGCTLDFSLRPHPCNLYLCRTVIKLCPTDYSYYTKERKDYFSYCNFFDDDLKYNLIENNVDFTTDYIKSLELIKKFKLPKFKFRKLKDLDFNKNS